MKEYEDEIPNYEDTPLKKNRKLKILVDQRQQAAGVIADAEVTKKECSTEILTILTSAGVEKCRVGACAVSVVTTERTTINEGMLKKALLEGGMSLQKIEKLWLQCSTSSKSSYVKVTERKG